jgi:hypothetical protein
LTVIPPAKLVVRIARNEISVETAQRGKGTAAITSQSLRHRTIERFQTWAKEAEPRLRDLSDYELFGRHLYEFLFQGDIERALDDAYSRADENKTQLRLELLIDADATDLAGVPWEFLYFQPGADRKRGFFMGTHSGFSLIRTDSSTLDTSSILLDTVPRILVVASCPDSLDYVVWRPVADEITDRLKAKFVLPADKASDPEKAKGKTEAEVQVLVDIPELTMLTDALKWRPHILQFIGHGMQDGSEGKLAVLNGKPPWITGTQLVNLFSNIPRAERPRLVVLHACEGGATARATLSPKFGFGSVAAMLLAEDIPAVVAMQYEIDQDSAITFTSNLYTDLFDGRAIHEAVQSGRSTLWTSSSSRPARAFGAPVLYMSGTDGVLFTKKSEASDTRNQINRDGRSVQADDPSSKGASAPFGTSGFGGTK